MIVGLPPGAPDAIARAPIARCDIGFHADDRLEPGFFGLFLEVPCSVKVAVIGDRQSGLFELQRSTEEITDAVCTVEKRVFGVAMEVDEGHMIRICDAVSSR